MYIRIQDQTIRFRLSMQEARKIIAGDILCDSLPLVLNKTLSYQVCSSNDDNHFEYKDSMNKLILHINKNNLTSEISTRPSKKGIFFEHQVGQKKIIISLEVNLKNMRRSHST
ncbi:MAG: hypothetical protein L3J46_06275 [Kangiellaceae bacterium]|nr:hypothetical protein [Kangiellaceae bacterium]